MRKLEEVVFWRSYVSACNEAGGEPAKGLRGQVGRPTLELSRAETFSVDDWKPLLATLNKDNSLHYITLSASSTRYQVLEGLVYERDVRGARRTPALYTKYLMGSLAASLSNMIAVSRSLTSLLISKIPIKGQYLDTLCQGIGKTRSIQHLALHHCPVEDTGCDILCKALASRPTLTTLDLTDCALTHVASSHIALLIKKQNSVRLGEVWKGSLRYGKPDGDEMPGLRRLTLNLNPGIGDSGLKSLTVALQDDLWIKGVDMQGCNVTDEGVDTVSHLLEQNRGLTVFDLRGNPAAISALPTLMSRLRTNLAFSKPGPYKCKWMEEVKPPSGQVSLMTLASQSTPATPISPQRSEISVRSNMSEPPWINTPNRKPAYNKNGRRVIKGHVTRTKSLENSGAQKWSTCNVKYGTSTIRKEETAQIVAVKRVNFMGGDSVENDHEEEGTNERESRKPFIGVSQEQRDILNNFKTFTQSFINARGDQNQSNSVNKGDNAAIKPGTILPSKRNMNLACGDCGGDYSTYTSYVRPQAKKLEAGDAPSGDEDAFKERTHQLLRKLIQLRTDRGLKSNEGVMRVCSQLSLPEAQLQKKQEQLVASSSFTTLPQTSI